MFALLIFLISIFVVLGFLGLSAWSDLKGMVIPNMHSLVIIGVFIGCYAVLWLLGREDVFAPFWSHIVGAVIVFVITLIMFTTKVLGGGDAKLATAVALWTGLKGMIPFVFYMTLIGGVLGLAALYLQKKKPFKKPKKGTWIARVQGGESKVPYGVAIALGALASFVKIGYFDLEVLSSFVMG